MREIEVLEAGALSTVQDTGRAGFAHLGVPHSGAVDDPAYRLANRLVGNPEGLAVIETTLTGITFRARYGCRFAVTGAEAAVRVDGREVGWGTPVSVPPAAEVQVGAAVRGLRSYVAFAGGVDVEPVLGSRSSDLLSGLGPAVLRTGDVLPIGPAAAAPSEVEAVRRPSSSVLGLDLGPRADWFTDAAVASLDGARYTVAADSNRIGVRLSGTPLDRALEGELPTEPMVLGGIQVPPSGQPLIFLNDHPTTGGYPVIGVVRARDLPVCAQARPGDVLTLRVLGR